MHDAGGMRNAEGIADVDGVPERETKRDRPALDRLRQCLSRDELHHDRAMVADVDDIVNRRNVRVVESRERLRLALEARPQPCVAVQ
jgi:hypothetical protein